jgi:hypothetical protein
MIPEGKKHGWSLLFGELSEVQVEDRDGRPGSTLDWNAYIYSLSMVLSV